MKKLILSVLLLFPLSAALSVRDATPEGTVESAARRMRSFEAFLNDYFTSVADGLS